MPRLPNKGYTARAPDGAGSWPEIPDLDPQLSEIDGGKTNAAFQRWNDLVRARLGGNEQQDNGRFKNIQSTITLQNGYLESVWTMQAIAGPVVTGMVLFSSIDPDSNTIVSRVTFQADVFQIQTASGDHQTVFSTSADAVKLGDVLTVDLANAKVFIGTGTYGNANTAFYVDDDGFFSLKAKLTFDPTGAGTLTVTGTIIAGAGLIGGWVIGSTFLADAGGLVGMSSAVTAGDDVRFWAGNATAAIAPFRVTESGLMTATNGVFSGTITSTAGTIGGFTIGATSLSAVSGSDSIELNSGGGGYLRFDSTGSSISQYAIEGVLVQNAAGNNVLELRSDSGSATYGVLDLYNGASGTPSIQLNGNTGVITATSYAGSGASLTGITATQVGLGNVPNVNATNASNISSGTLPNARLSFSKTGTADVPVDGFVSVGGVKLATVA